MSANTSSTKKIKIALLSAEPLFWETCAKKFFKIILHNYTWNTNKTCYQFTLQNITDPEIRQGKLLTKNINVLLIPGGGVGDGHSISKGFNTSLKTKKWKKNIQNYIKNGGGCIGFCGGASLITNLTTGETRPPTTFVERQYNKSSLGISEVSSYYKHLAFPLFYLFQYNNPEKIGTTAYVFSFKPGETKDGKRIHSGGVPIEYTINNDHPIFTDYTKKTLTMRWWGGQALQLPKKPQRPITTLATYPQKDLYEQNRTKIHAWRYTGSIPGLFKGFTKSLKFIKQNHLKLTEFPMLTYYFAKNWELTTNLIQSDLANKPAITTEIYPNEHQGRITLCTSHPEYMIWYNGHIQETNDTTPCLATGLYQWKDITPFTQPDDKQITHTWWFVRRLIAWTGKVPDTDLPPIIQQKLTQKDRQILQPNIYWDGTAYNQIQNI
jgi:hypothetical protein